MGKIGDSINKLKDSIEGAKNIANSNKNWIISIIVSVLIIGLFIGGIMLGKGCQKSADLKDREKTIQKDIKTQNQIIKNSEQEAKKDIDSAGIYEEFARRQEIETEKIKTKIKNVKAGGIKDIENVDKNDRIKNIKDFIEHYGEEYEPDTTNL